MPNHTTKTTNISFQTFPNDAINVQHHTLSNGMQLFLSINKEQPRIFTNLVVRAGSKFDPAETTGLAHYLEHMMFKGSSRIGALNWETEKVLLQKISDLYEAHRNETDAEKRRAIYAEIDSVSNDAAQYVAANEYDKLVSALGAKSTNAYTWLEQTVYVNDIPSNELERWMELETERFSRLVLRLFHTELETVYEEFNISQDRDARKVLKSLYQGLFPAHPYGTQTTMGEGEHLKNPSHVNIHRFFSTYYVPNNMAMVLSGDFDAQEVVRLAEKYFGQLENKGFHRPDFAPMPPLEGITRREVVGQEAASVYLAWRFGGAKTSDPLILELINAILWNRQAGIIDIDLIQQQKLLEAYAYSSDMEDYTAFTMYGKPREGQTLEEVEKLLIQSVEKLKKGKFEDWLVTAAINNFKLQQMRAYETNENRVANIADAYIKGISWADYAEFIGRVEQVTKADIIKFTNEYFKDNYVVVYKKQGTDADVMKVEKPTITPVTLNRTAETDFAQQLMGKTTPALTPQFIDFQKDIHKEKLDCGIDFHYIKNENAALFNLYYMFDFGYTANPLLSVAGSYVPLLGTKNRSAADVKKEFFRLGLSFVVHVQEEKLYFQLSGLDASFEEGMLLMEEILHHIKGKQAVLDNLIADVLARRANNKKDKNIILRQYLMNYAKFGKKSHLTDCFSEAELKAITSRQLTDAIKKVTNMEHRIVYYGSKSAQEVKQSINKHHIFPTKLQGSPTTKVYPERETLENTVLFFDFPMVQTDILLLSKGTPHFSLEEYAVAEVYNQYFGSGLSSIVFQEIREARGLAYSTYAWYGSPQKQQKAHYLQAYLGTQPDKLQEAIPALRHIMEEMPLLDAPFENARHSVLKQIESERVSRSELFNNYYLAKARGLDTDIRKNVYEIVQKLTLSDLDKFHQKHIKNRGYNFVIMGNRQNINMKYLESIGKVHELNSEEVFGY
jgi:zinc protease